MVDFLCQLGWSTVIRSVADLPQARGNSAADGLQTSPAASALPWSSSLLPHLEDFGLTVSIIGFASLETLIEQV